MDALPWHKSISNYDAKWAVALEVAERVKDGNVIGAGSGSSSFLAIKAIAERMMRDNIAASFIPTSKETELTCRHFGLTIASLASDVPNWCFDGADEIDPQNNLIKGRGGAMYREKLVMQQCTDRVILADSTKNVHTLGQKFAIPVEVEPEAIHVVAKSLKALGARLIDMRTGAGKDGPVFTEQGCVILDASFDDIDAALEKRIKSITGVLESGLFWGYQPEILNASD